MSGRRGFGYRGVRLFGAGAARGVGRAAGSVQGELAEWRGHRPGRVAGRRGDVPQFHLRERRVLAEAECAEDVEGPGCASASKRARAGSGPSQQASDWWAPRWPRSGPSTMGASGNFSIPIELDTPGGRSRTTAAHAPITASAALAGHSKNPAFCPVAWARTRYPCSRAQATHAPTSSGFAAATTPPGA